MRFKEVEQLLLSLGFMFSRCKGSHNMYVHPNGIRPVLLCRNGNNKTFGKALIAKIISEANSSIRLGLEAKNKTNTK